MGSLTKNLQQIIQQQQLLLRGESVVVAVSGGADSMALLHLLAELAPALKIRIHAATLDHDLRPGSAEAAAFVAEAAGALGIPVMAGRVNVRELAEVDRESVELAGRKARYRFLAEAAREASAKKVVTAHHAGDQAETVLMHILRGSGMRGAGAMKIRSTLPYAEDLELIRPLLTFSRSDLRDYCARQGFEFREDPTNLNREWLRNRLRHDVLPLLRETVNPRVEQSLARFAEINATEDDFMTQMVSGVIDAHVEYSDERAEIDREAFSDLHPALQRRLLAHLLIVSFPDTEPGYAHLLHAVRVAASGDVGAVAEFPGGVQLRVAYATLVIEAADARPDTQGQFLLANGDDVSLHVPGDTPVSGTVHVLVAQRGKSGGDNPAIIEVAIKEGQQLILRGRRPGDRFCPAGMEGHSQKLKDWMINRKIPHPLRDRVPLLVCDGAILGIYWESVWHCAHNVPENNTKLTFSLFFHKQLIM